MQGNKVQPYILNLHFCSDESSGLNYCFSPPSLLTSILCCLFCHIQKQCNNFDRSEKLSATELVIENFPLVLSMNRWKRQQINYLGFAVDHCKLDVLIHNACSVSIHTIYMYMCSTPSVITRKLNLQVYLCIYRKGFMHNISWFLRFTELFLHWSCWSQSWYISGC